MKATPTQDNGIGKVHRRRSQSDIEKSISFAAYRAISSLFDRFPVILADLDTFFASLGYDKTDVNQNIDNPAGIGNRAAAFVLAAARRYIQRKFFSDSDTEMDTINTEMNLVPKELLMEITRILFFFFNHNFSFS